MVLISHKSEVNSNLQDDFLSNKGGKKHKIEHFLENDLMESYSEIVFKEFECTFYNISYFYTKYLTNYFCSLYILRIEINFNATHRVLLALALV